MSSKYSQNSRKFFKRIVQRENVPSAAPSSNKNDAFFRHPQNRSQKDSPPPYFLRIGPLQNAEFKARSIFTTPFLCALSRLIPWRQNWNPKNFRNLFWRQEGGSERGNYGHQNRLSLLRTLQIYMQFKTDHTVHSWEYLPESTCLCDINSLGCTEAVNILITKRAWNKQNISSERKNIENQNSIART